MAVGEKPRRVTDVLLSLATLELRMDRMSLSIPAWLVAGLSPLVRWGVSGPYPQSKAKRAGLAAAAVLLRLAVSRAPGQWGYGGYGPHDKLMAGARRSLPRARDRHDEVSARALESRTGACE